MTSRLRNPVLVSALVAVAAAAPFFLTDFRLQLLSKFLCLAMVAAGIGLSWGQGGMLTLGQGVFFGLGAYLMAMHMKLADAGPGGVPDFMLLYGSGELPWWWEPLRNPIAAVALIVLVPATVALVLGLGVFKRRVRGSYFTILSQTLVAAFAILLVGQQQTTGGTNGLNGFRTFFGYDLRAPENHLLLYYLCFGVLAAMALICWQLRRSRMGELLTAVRDEENRVRFLGYDPALVKVGTFVLAAVFAAIGGALFVPAAGMISPSDVGVSASIGFVIGVAIGGRATVLGPVLGSLAVSIARTSLSETFPSGWTYFQAALFIVVVALLPGGLMGLGHRFTLRRRTSESTSIGSAPVPAQGVSA